MNKSFIFGVLFSFVVLYFGVFSHAKNPSIFLDSHAILLVLGGTTTSALIAYRGRSLSRIFDFFLWGVVFRRTRKRIQLTKNLIMIRSRFLDDQNFLDDESYDPFLREGMRFLYDNKLSMNDFILLLQGRAAYFQKLYKDDAKILTSLGKYPPAFGLLGASTGMIEMMQNLGSGGSQSIGQAMAIALVATFWGIALANFFILPLADSANKSAQEDVLFREMIIEGLVLIRKRATDRHFRTHIRSHLSLEDRLDLVNDPIYSFITHANDEEVKAA